MSYKESVNYRWTLPVKAIESALDQDASLTCSRRRVFLDPRDTRGSITIVGADEVKLESSELENLPSSRWIFYKTYEKVTPVGQGEGVDVVFVHARIGYAEYGGLHAYDIRPLLNAGFRVHLMDMPGHGRSSGLAAYIPVVRHLPEAVHAVVLDVAERDVSPRQFFLAGMSLGGLTVLMAAEPRQNAKADQLLGRMLGVYAFCPVVGMVAPVPPPFITTIGRMLAPLLGRSGAFAPRPADNISDDPRMFTALGDDPLAYVNKMRMASGLAFLEGFQGLNARASTFTAPVCIAHGDHDRNTSHLASQAFIDRCASSDKTMKIHEGYEHVLVKVIAGKVEPADEARNEVILEHFLTWMCERTTRRE